MSMLQSKCYLSSQRWGFLTFGQNYTCIYLINCISSIFFLPFTSLPVRSSRFIAISKNCYRRLLITWISIYKELVDYVTAKQQQPSKLREIHVRYCGPISWSMLNVGGAEQGCMDYVTLCVTETDMVLQQGLFLPKRSPGWAFYEYDFFNWATQRDLSRDTHCCDYQSRRRPAPSELGWR